MDDSGAIGGSFLGFKLPSVCRWSLCLRTVNVGVATFVRRGKARKYVLTSLPLILDDIIQNNPQLINNLFEIS